MNKRFFQSVIILILLLSANTAYSQSIGATPKKDVEVKTNTPALVSFGVSQGADYPERITIEGDYEWLAIEERNFTLDSKTKKSVEMIVKVKRPGTHTASLRICASPLSPEGAVLSTKACTPHKLTVIASWDKATKVIIFVVVCSFLGLVVFLAVYFFRRGLRPKKSKSVGRGRRIRK